MTQRRSGGADRRLADLTGVRWIGGSPCSGKSTVAAALGLPVYSCDAAVDRHTAMAGAADGPTLTKVAAMDVADRLDQPVAVQVDDVLRLYREQFPLVLADLAGPRAVVAEGAALLPDLLAGLGVARDHAVWLVPTERFQRHHYRQRAWAHELLAGTADPAGAFDRWMRRDAAFARHVAGRARALGYRVVVVDGRTGPGRVAAGLRSWMIDIGP